MKDPLAPLRDASGSFRPGRTDRSTRTRRGRTDRAREGPDDPGAVGRAGLAVLVGAVLVLTVFWQTAERGVPLVWPALLFVGVAVAAVVRAERAWDRAAAGWIALQTLAGLALAWVLVRQWAGGMPATGRGWHVAAVGLAIVALPLLAPGLPAYLRANAGYLLAFGAVLGAYLVHVPGLAAGSGLASFPVFAGVVFGLGLLVLPRYVPWRDFLWVVATVTAGVVVLGLLAYWVGPYRIGPTAVGLWGSDRIVGISTGVPAMTSVFANPNTLGLVAFAGTVAAFVRVGDALRAGLVEGHTASRWRAIAWDRVATVTAAGLLLAVDAVGLGLSLSAGAMLAAGVAGAIYLAAALGGSRGRRLGFVAVVGAVGLVLALALAGVVPISLHGRAALWTGSLVAIVWMPSPVGYGIVSAAEVIEPYVAGPASGYSPHNSYLATFIRAGMVGGIGYLVVTMGNVLDGALGWPPGRAVDPGVLALAAGFAIHQLFEAYSLFGIWIGSVLGALAVGYLLADRVREPAADDRPDGAPERL